MIEWYLLALMSAFFSASAAIFEKKTLFKETALNFSFILAIFNFLIAFLFFPFISFLQLTSISLIILFFKSILGALAFLSVMISLKRLEISKALPLLVLTPGLVAITSFIFLKEALNSFEILGLIFLMIGTYILQIKSKNNQKLLDPLKTFFNKSYFYILTALILFTITSVLDKALLKNFQLQINAFMFFQHFFLAIIFMIIFLIFSEKRLSFKSWKLILIVSIFTIIYRYTQINAVRLAPVALVLSLKRVSVFFAVLIGGTLFKDKNLFIRIIATAIMITGAVLVIVF